MEADYALTVGRNLTVDESQRIVDAFVALNPTRRGATCADILDELHDADAFLAVTEPGYEALTSKARLPGCAVAMIALHMLGKPITDEAVLRLLTN